MDPIKEAMIREEDTGEINPNLDWFRERPGVRHFLEQRDELVSALSATVGYMRNAQIDLETGAPKKTAVQTIQGGIKLAEAALTKIAGCPVCGRSSDTQDCERDNCGVMQPSHRS